MPKPKKEELLVKISPSIVIFTFLFVLGLWFIEKITNVLFIVFIAYIISVGLNKPINKIQIKFNWKRSTSSIFVYALFVVLFGTFLGLIIPPLINELSSMLSVLHVPPEIDKLINNFEIDFQDINVIAQQLGGSLSTAINVISSTFSGILTIMMILVISLYMSIEKGEVVRDFSWITKDDTKIKQFKEVIHEINIQLGNWIRGEFTLMLIVGTMIFIGTALIGLPYPLPLALIAGLMEIIPNIGPTIAAIPAVFIALITLGWPGAVATLILHVLVQQLENSIIVPRVMQKNINISGLTIILGILIGGTVFGVLGALLAVPIIIVLRTSFETWIKYKPKKDLI